MHAYYAVGSTSKLTQFLMHNSTIPESEGDIPNKQFGALNWFAANISMLQQSALCLILFFSAGCGNSTPVEDNHKNKSTDKRQTEQGLKRIAQDAPDSHHKQKKRLKTVKVAKVEEGKQAIVLLHGLNRLSHDFDVMKAALKKKFPHITTIVALKCVDKDSSKKSAWYISPSMEYPIKEQARLAYEEMKEVLGSGKHVVMVGHSQGGLRGFTLIKEHADALKKEIGLTIEQLITIGTPWKGAPIMDHLKDPKSALKKLDGCKSTFNAIHKEYSRNVTKHLLKTELAEIFPFFFKHLGQNFIDKKTPGAANLKPGSHFIRYYVAPGIKETSVPIKAIAGVLVDFSKLFNAFPSYIGKEELKKMNCTYAELIGGDPECEHDMLLPVSTQHAEGLEKKDFECIKIYDTCHGNKVGISVKKGISEINNQQVIQKVVEIIEDVFYKEDQVEEVVVQEAAPEG
ncbi:alpha/beta hydrolase [Cardinium endosymbiont of Tipula unca]|uniref:esterase/lipase family protein n=1 Tax=Cardinium endosymbiont of Tipula unca TaxID=3066216 RepID=UPI0030CB7809